MVNYLQFLLQNLRNRSMNFILSHFDDVSRTTGFEEMGRLKVDLGEFFTLKNIQRGCSFVILFLKPAVFEILRKR